MSTTGDLSSRRSCSTVAPGPRRQARPTLGLKSYLRFWGLTSDLLCGGLSAVRTWRGDNRCAADISQVNMATGSAFKSSQGSTDWGLHKAQEELSLLGFQDLNFSHQGSHCNTVSGLPGAKSELLRLNHLKYEGNFSFLQWQYAKFTLFIEWLGIGKHRVIFMASVIWTHIRFYTAQSLALLYLQLGVSQAVEAEYGDLPLARILIRMWAIGQ